MIAKDRSLTQPGFTLVELLIVIIVIAILAAITVVAYNGVQTSARDAQRMTDIRNVQQQIELYYAKNGYYPRTSTNPIGGGNTARTDDNCPYGSSQSDWVPELDTPLPQSVQSGGQGVSDIGGCYMYSSDGQLYVLSAWNVLEEPQSDKFYRRLGFREMMFTQHYICNHPNIGGNSTGTYTINGDYYKHSYTISNVTNCNETPPSGA